MASIRHRPTLINKLADCMMAELRCRGRSRNTSIGDKFDGLKTKIRYRFPDEDEQKQICLLMASVVVDADALCTVTAKRLPPTQRRFIGQKFKDRQ